MNYDALDFHYVTETFLFLSLQNINIIIYNHKILHNVTTRYVFIPVPSPRLRPKCSKIFGETDIYFKTTVMSFKFLAIFYLYQ